MTTGKKIALGIGCAVPILCCAGGALLLQGTFGKAAGNLRQQLDAARKEGIPVEARELDAKLAVSEAENAAPLYRKVLADVAEGKPLKRAFDAINKGIGPSAKSEDRQAADAALKQMTSQLATAEQASRLPRCVWGHDWSKGANLLFPELAPMKGLVKVFAYRAQRQSDGGDWQGALKCLATAQRIARHAGDDPTLIAALVQIAGESIVIRSLDELVVRNGRNAVFVHDARQLLAGFGPVPNLRRAMGSEVVMGRAAIRTMKSTRDFMSSSTEGGPSQAEQAVFSVPMVKDAFDARYVEVYREMIHGMPEDPEQWEAAAATMKNIEAKVMADQSPSNRLNQILFPVFSQSAEAVGQLLMHRRLTETSLRLLEEKTKTGAFPARLPDYGKVRVDPFSGDPFHYGRVGGGFKLYSVGRDRTDDGGTPVERGRTSENHDEVIIIK